MLSTLTRMAGGMTPAMYRYVRSYIRFLLPRRDRPLASLIRQMRFLQPGGLEGLEQRLSVRYKPRRLEYLLERLRCLMEEVFLDPMQPWNAIVNGSGEIAIQRKLLGGLRMASAGLLEPAHQRLREVQQAVEEDSGSLGLKLQVSLYAAPENPDEVGKVSERAGSLADEYLSVMRAQEILKDCIAGPVLTGIIPDRLPLLPDNRMFPATRLTDLVFELLHLAREGKPATLKRKFEQLKRCAREVYPAIPFLEAMVQARIGLCLVARQDAFAHADYWLEQAFSVLPTDHALYPEVFRYHLQFLILKGNPREVQRQLDHSGKLILDEKSLQLDQPMIASLLAFLNEESGKALQCLVQIPLNRYSDSMVRVYELFHYFDQGHAHTAECRLEAFRKMLTRKGTEENRGRQIQRIMVRLNSCHGDHRTLQRLHQDLLLELTEEYPWTPATGEWFPFEVWAKARLHQKSLSAVSQIWLRSLL